MNAPVPHARAIGPSDRIDGGRVILRLVTLEDCTQRYVDWLADPEVNRYLETRYHPQPIDAIRQFVSGMLESPDSYLFAIVERETGRHIGNIKVGPVNAVHSYADVSYFIGERACWGQGYATLAIVAATRFGFDTLHLHRLQAGVYEGNTGSERALVKAGYAFEGRLRSKLRTTGEHWEDHIWYGALRDSWTPPSR